MSRSVSKASHSEEEEIIYCNPIDHNLNSRINNLPERNDLHQNEYQNMEAKGISKQEQLRFQARFELPKLQTPIFQGSFDTWFSFHDSFKSMYHDNPHIPSIQKTVFGWILSGRYC